MSKNIHLRHKKYSGAANHGFTNEFNIRDIMHSYKRFQCPGALGLKGGQVSTYGSDFKPPTDRPLRLFRLHPEPSHTTHQKMADMWTEYHKHTFQAWNSGPRNPASAFTQGRTKMSFMLEKERAKLMRTQFEKPLSPNRGPDPQGACQRLSPDTGEGWPDKPPPPLTAMSGDKLLSPCLSRTSMLSGVARHPPVLRREAWSQAMGDPQGANVVMKEDPEEDRAPEDHLPFIREVSDRDLLQQGECLRPEQLRRSMTHSSRLEGQLNKRIAAKSNYMHIGLMFDGVTTYSQSYTHRGSSFPQRGQTRLVCDTTPQWRDLSSEYTDRYKGPRPYLPGKSKPPSGLEEQLQEGSSSNYDLQPKDQRKALSKSEYQREFNQRIYPCQTKASSSLRH